MQIEGDGLLDDYKNSLDMPDKNDLLSMIEDAKNDSNPDMQCGLDHLRLMRVIRDYGDRRWRAGFRDAIRTSEKNCSENCNECGNVKPYPDCSLCCGLGFGKDA